MHFSFNVFYRVISFKQAQTVYTNIFYSFFLLYLPTAFALCTSSFLNFETVADYETEFQIKSKYVQNSETPEKQLHHHSNKAAATTATAAYLNNSPWSLSSTSSPSNSSILSNNNKNNNETDRTSSWKGGSIIPIGKGGSSHTHFFTSTSRATVLKIKKVIQSGLIKSSLTRNVNALSDCTDFRNHIVVLGTIRSAVNLVRHLCLCEADEDNKELLPPVVVLTLSSDTVEAERVHHPKDVDVKYLNSVCAGLIHGVIGSIEDLMRSGATYAAMVVLLSSRQIEMEEGKRRRSNVAVIIVEIFFVSLFLFHCLVYNHSFHTIPNSGTNLFKLIQNF